MDHFRFRDTGALRDGLIDLLRKQVGWNMVRDKNDLVVRAVNAKILDQDKKLDLLAISQIHSIDESDHTALTDALLSYIPSEAAEFYVEPPERIHTTKDLGIVSEIDRITKLLWLSLDEQRRQIIRDELIPLMKKIRATHVIAITARPIVTATIQSFLKLALMGPMVGLVEAERLIRKEGILLRLLPPSINATSIIESFVVFAPRAVALPISFRGCTFLFIRNGGWLLSSQYSTSFFDYFRMANAPTSESLRYNSVPTIKFTELVDYWRYISFLTHGINRIFRFLSEPRNFIDSDGYVNCLKQLQFYVAMNLIFADLNALAFEVDAHKRTTLGFTCIDKFANLITEHQSKSPADESQIFQTLLSLRYARSIRKILQKSTRERWPIVNSAVSAEIKRLYTSAHWQLRSEMGARGLRDQDRVERLKAHRNIQTHGIFLKKDPFERFFLRYSGAIPNFTSSIPQIISFGMIADFKAFLKSA